MTRLRSTLIALLALAFVAAPATAQTSESNSLSASLTIVPSITITKDTDLTFPDSPNGAGLVPNDQRGRFSISADPGLDVSVALSGPSSLTDGNGNSVPLVHDGTEGLLFLCDNDGDGSANNIDMDPTASTPQVASCIVGDGTGHFLNIGDSDPVEADLSTDVPPGTYTGTYTLTLTAN